MWRAAGLAAALFLVTGAGLLFLLPGGGGGAGGAGSSGASTFMSYAGPVMPLTLWEANKNITAERDITLDFAPWTEDKYSTGILVTDAYTLTNTSGQDQTVTVFYPFASKLYSLEYDLPLLTLDGRELETVLHTGNYTGGYEGAYGRNGPEEGSVNLDRPDNWEA